jgi:hypothetical protein
MSVLPEDSFSRREALSLHDLQQAFAQAIFGGDEEAMAGQVRAQDFSAAQRLQLYRNNSFIGLREALAGVYPVVKQLLGEAFFAQTAAEFVAAHPSTSGNLHDYGGEFADFLARMPTLAQLVYLPDVARLEWAYHSAFHSAREDGFVIDALAGLSEEQAANLKLMISPACYLLRSAYPVLRIWQHNQPDADADEFIGLDAGGVCLALLRDADQVRIHVLTPGIYGLLSALAAGDSLSAACASAVAEEPGCDVSTGLQYLVGHDFVCGYSR